MKFGQVDNPDSIDFSIPADHADTVKMLKKSKAKDLKIHVGCAKWNKTDAAALLGLNRDQIRYRIEKFQIERSTPPSID